MRELATVEDVLRSLEDRLRDLEDREAIRTLLATFCRAVDKKDRDLFLSVWEPDARWAVGKPLGFAVGHEEISANLERVWGALPESYHQTSNIVIAVDGDSAQAVCDVVCTGTDASGRAVLIGGAYSDDLHRGEDSAWRLVEHRVEIHYWAPVSDPWTSDPQSHMKLPG